MRLHKPVGTLLLWAPTAWALWIASHGSPPLTLVLYFALGTLVMRSAGCVINDMADMRFDRHVQRTASRPLATGALGLTSAFLLLIFLLLIALFIILQLPLYCFYEALVALGIIGVYPFCKRWVRAPQLVLGLAFSMGIPMAYTALDVQWDRTMLMLLVINFLWILAYDTMYAMADKEDDLKIGIQSTAILFGSWARGLILILQMASHLLWLTISTALPLGVMFYICWAIGIGFIVHQQALLKRGLDLSAFSNSVWYGMVLWGGLM